MKTDEQQRMLWQREQIDAASGYVFAQVGWTNAEALELQLVEQLSLDQVDLAEVRLGRISRKAGAMLNRKPFMSVTSHATIGDHLDLRDSLLREPM